MPITRGRCSIPAIAAASNVAPAVSQPGTAGTHDGTVTYTRSGNPSLAASMYSTPARPVTLPISWGSITTVVVPSGSTPRAKAGGVTIVDSIWTWVSMNPGMAISPVASITSAASSPRRAP